LLTEFVAQSNLLKCTALIEVLNNPSINLGRCSLHYQYLN